LLDIVLLHRCHASSNATVGAAALYARSHCRHRRGASTHLHLLGLLATETIIPTTGLLLSLLLLLMLQNCQLAQLLRHVLLVLLELVAFDQAAEDDVRAHPEPVLWRLGLLSTATGGHRILTDLVLGLPCVLLANASAGAALVKALAHVLLEILFVVLITLQMRRQLAVL